MLPLQKQKQIYKLLHKKTLNNLA